jgi:hypothetical protein
MLLMLVHPTGEGHDEKGKWIQSSAHGARNYRPECRLTLPIISMKLSSCTVRGSDEKDVVTNANHWPMTLGTELDWGFVTVPNPNLNGRAISYSM